LPHLVKKRLRHNSETAVARFEIDDGI